MRVTRAALTLVSLLVRPLAAAPIFSISVVASLAIGIAGTSASFAVLHGLMFRPVMHVNEPERVARISVSHSCGWRGCHDSSSTVVDYLLPKQSLPSFDAVAARAYANVPLHVDGDAVPVRAEIVSANFFDVLDMQPAPGRGFRAEEERAGHGGWR